MKLGAIYTVLIGAFIAVSTVFQGQVNANEVTDYTSLKVEIRRAIDRGNQFLASQQADEGHWGDPDYPAFTAMALQSAVRAPGFDINAESYPAHIERGLETLLKYQKDDGGFYQKGLFTYNTSAAMMALLATGREQYHEAILKARRKLVGDQADYDTPGETDNPLDGGIGYGSTKGLNDLSNTHLALEALHYSKQLVTDAAQADEPKLNWDAAIEFVSRCQNLRATNDQEWASDDPTNKGGFIYHPGSSKAGTTELEGGRTALRSYGSMSYAGLLSLVFADLKQDDPRVIAVKKWLSDNFTLDENPGMGQQGLYYYYHTMAKALAAANIKTLVTEDGSKIDWRRDLSVKLVSSQREDGSWVNENNRWWEGEAVLSTCYSIMALQQIYYSIPE